MKIVSRIILVVAVAVFAFSLWKLWGYYRNYHGGSVEYEDLRKYTEENDSAKDGDVCPIRVDFEALRKINPDVVGWIYIDENLSYPVVQGQDNDYYLHRTFEGSENFTGAIFLDSMCLPPFETTNSIIYGHNLKTGKMFGYLKRYYDTAYNEKADYREHEIIWIITPEEEREYKVFAAREINVDRDGDVYTIEFADEDSYQAYLEDCLNKSLYETRTRPDPAVSMVTLSTCTSSTEEGRFIVQATLVQSGEHED